ncbi:MAG TPA: hypothetical protein VJP59_01120 [Gemmatimonadota bacterium]|nr:hypothetical protein [Gemmatimonadota bacterium]
MIDRRSPGLRAGLVIGLLAMTACLRSQAGSPPSVDAGAVFRQIHDRYTGKRFTHVTFVQRTEPADGPVELWYEAIRPPGLVRVDKAPLQGLDGLMYRRDSLYTFDAGDVVVAKGDERWITMLVLVDIYALPLDATLMRLRELGVDLDAMHESHWLGRPVLVTGALAGDTTAAQIWYDREHLYPVRVIQPPGGGHPRVEFQMSHHRFMEGGWIEGEIRILVGGRLVTTECYAEVRPHPGLAEELFDPHAFATRRWAETEYPEVDSPPECARPDEDAHAPPPVVGELPAR